MAAKRRKGLRILVTNDDGVNAPGLKALEHIAAQLSDDVFVVAPENEQSGASHSLTLTYPLRLREITARRFSVLGTPTDCVMMAIKEVLADHPPDLVLSGVNRGANMADDVTYSGTIAAAMEGVMFGVPSIALSQAYGFDGTTLVKWSTAEHHGPAVIARLLERGWPRDVLININFPDVTRNKVRGVQVTLQGRRDQSMVKLDRRLDGRGHPYYWLGFERAPSNPPEGSDLKAIYGGFISVTPLHLDLSHHDTLDHLRAVFPDTPVKASKAPKAPKPVKAARAAKGGKAAKAGKSGKAAKGRKGG